MKVYISIEATNTIHEIARYIESQNTKGSGKRFANKFLQNLIKTLKKFNHHITCRFPEFADKNWRCFNYKNWIVAYESNEKTVSIKVIIHGSLLNY
jgi:hypothetical protein